MSARRPGAESRGKKRRAREAADAERLWYRDAVIYELHIKAFSDSNGDGMGDFRGLTEKLDYLADLGVTALWLLPFYPSPLKDDGYDIADPRSIHADYGTMKDFKVFVREAHRRGMRVITELVLNHTSDQHAWFQRARRSRPGTAWRNYYVWSDTPDRYRDARIIFKDFESSNWSWDPVAGAYFWHRFYSHQPDLNYDSPHVRKAVTQVIDFWFKLGVDGLRLDAAPYLFEREGTNCENLPETHGFLKELRKHVDSRFDNRLLLAEANQWPEDASAYFGEGDECHMAFHFPLMPRIFMAVQMEDSFPVTDILEQTPSIPPTCQWALFLRNHDELTLEMVTDEERDYMYRVYASDPRSRINLGIRRRLAPLLGNNRKKIELMNILLFTFPGTPVLYYGDEIGMGDNYYLGDRDGVRTPMQWSADRNAGFSRANPQQLYLPVIIDPEYHYEALNVENQQRNPSSLLWWMKRLLEVRKRFRAFGRGTLRFLASENSRVLAFLRQLEGEDLLVVVNLSRFSQVVELDLSEFSGAVPVDVFSLNPFPAIRELPTAFMMGPHGYYIFRLRKAGEAGVKKAEKPAAEMSVSGGWTKVLTGRHREHLEDRVLPAYLESCPWFRGGGRTIRSVQIERSVPVGPESDQAAVCILRVDYSDGSAERYLLPLAVAHPLLGADIAEVHPYARIAGLTVDGREGELYDGIFSRSCQASLLEIILRRRRIKGKEASLQGMPGRQRRYHARPGDLAEGSTVQRAESGTPEIIFPDGLLLKLYRQIEEGDNPDLEISRFLTLHSSYQHVFPFAGMLDMKARSGESFAVAQLMGQRASSSDGWSFAVEAFSAFYERVHSLRKDYEERKGDAGSEDGRILREAPPPPALLAPPEDLEGLESVPEVLRELMGTFFLEMVALLARRTAELHVALVSVAGLDGFGAEPFSLLYQRSVYQAMRGNAKKTLRVLRRTAKTLAAGERKTAEHVLSSEDAILRCFGKLLGRKIDTMKIRIHGDFHLGRVLFTGKDFLLTDFEGETSRPLSERRLPRSPLRDVAVMIRSLDYAAMTALLSNPAVREYDLPGLARWARFASACSGRLFLTTYCRCPSAKAFLPEEWEDITVLTKAFLLERALLELVRELEHRPEWAEIPLGQVASLLG